MGKGEGADSIKDLSLVSWSLVVLFGIGADVLSEKTHQFTVCLGTEL